MKLIILDRDGVINEDSDQYIKSADEWQPISGSLEAIARLFAAGFTLAIATNQAGIGRGLFSAKTLESIHNKLIKLVRGVGGDIATIAYCPHHPDDQCQCRKPQPGLVQQIEKNLNTSAEGAWFVGDSLKDLQAAKRAGCKPSLVLTGNGEQTFLSLEAYETLQSTPVFVNLNAFADSLLRG